MATFMRLHRQIMFNPAAISHGKKRDVVPLQFLLGCDRGRTLPHFSTKGKPVVRRGPQNLRSTSFGQVDSGATERTSSCSALSCSPVFS